MKFLALLGGLALELFFPRFQAWKRRWDLQPYLLWWGERASGRSGLNGPYGVLAVIAPVVLAAALVQGLLAQVLFGLLALLYGAAMLFYALRFHSLDRAIDAFCDACETGDSGRAGALAAEILGPSVLDHPEDQTIVAVSREILVQACWRLFGGMFWFMLLGPAGAALYCLSTRLSRPREGDPEFGAGLRAAARRLQGILDWVPARLSAAAYAVVGSFEDAAHGWSTCVTSADDLDAGNACLLAETGAGALQLERYATEADYDAGLTDACDPAAVRAARGLVLRALLAWVIFIAILSLLGWVS